MNGGLGWAEGLGSADLDLLRRLLAGQSTARIARGLGISFDAANDRLQALLSKLGVRSKLEAVTMASSRGVSTIGSGAVVARSAVVPP
ncbi:MAG: LuxR C-terminal-related transcriptional regulator [Acidimicrobiales bacterium]